MAVDARTLRELRTDELDPTARGRRAGAALRAEVEAVERAYERLFRVSVGLERDDLLRFGDGVLTLVSRWQPGLAAEMEGLAAGAGRAPEMVAMMNARTELTVAPECSSSARVSGAADAPWLAQNWDWYLDAPERCVLWNAASGDGQRFLTMTEAGQLAKLGVSTRGLAVGLNILHHGRDGEGELGVPIHLLLRQLLATCGSVEDAADLLGDVPLSASSAVTVVDARGGGATFELSPAGVRRIEPDADGFLAHTNHFLDAGLAAGESQHPYLEGSRARLATVRRIRPASSEAARAMLADHETQPQCLCRHGDHEDPGLPAAGTVVSLVLSPAAGSLAIAAGPPCTAPFTDHAV